LEIILADRVWKLFCKYTKQAMYCTYKWNTEVRSRDHFNSHGLVYETKIEDWP